MAPTENSVYRIEIDRNLSDKCGDFKTAWWWFQSLFYTENKFLKSTFCSITVNITLHEAHPRHLHLCIYCTLYSRGFSLQKFSLCHR